MMEYTRNAGATPKLTMSANESNSRPKGDSFFAIRATRPEYLLGSWLEDAKRWAAEDPYATGGVFARVTVKPFRLVLP